MRESKIEVDLRATIGAAPIGIVLSFGIDVGPAWLGKPFGRGYDLRGIDTSGDQIFLHGFGAFGGQALIVVGRT